MEQQIAELNAKLKWYEEQFLLSRQKQFGPSSEKTDSEQLSIFNEAEDTANPKLEEPDYETVTYRRKKQTGRRAEQLKGYRWKWLNTNCRKKTNLSLLSG